MSLTIYGTPRSRTMRVPWTAAELDLDYEHVPLLPGDPRMQEPGLMALNPAGTVPFIVADGFAMTESLAINPDLAKQYGSASTRRLHPSTVRGEAAASRWTLWAQAHLEPCLQRDARVASRSAG